MISNNLSSTPFAVTNNKKKVIAAVMGAFLGTAVIAVLLYILWRQRDHQKGQPPPF